jgi:hypothetical protein
MEIFRLILGCCIYKVVLLMRFCGTYAQNCIEVLQCS